MVGASKFMKFNVLDDISVLNQTLLLTLCGVTCCWGFANATILLVFASKVGFPLAVTACGMSSNFRQHSKMMIYYTILLIVIGFTFFYINNQFVIVDDMASKFQPSWFDLSLAVGLGWALSKFWHHPIRINVIVASAGLATLLPACIMAGYQLAHGNWNLVVDSLYLYSQYVGGMLAGALLNKELEKNDHS
jgi:hypothetical protein